MSSFLIPGRPLCTRGRDRGPKPGHIPGAVNLPANRLLDGHNPTLLKQEEEIRWILTSCGITPDKTIICSCGTGRYPTAVFLILKYFLGYPEVLMYEAGFTDDHQQGKRRKHERRQDVACNTGCPDDARE